MTDYNTLASGQGQLDMAMVHKFGQMAPVMTATGSTIDKRVSAASFMQMVTYILATGKMTNQMVVEFTFIRTVHHTKVTGLMTNTMAKARNSGQMELPTLVNTTVEESMVMDCLSGKMAAVTMESSLRIRCMATEYTNGVTEGNTMALGKIT